MFTLPRRWLGCFLMLAISQSALGQADVRVTSESLVGQKAGDDRGIVVSDKDNAGDQRDIAMMWCPAGKFVMGTPNTAEGPQRANERSVDVVMADGFWMGMTEITQAQFKNVTNTTPWQERGNKGFFQVGEDYPAVCISVREAYDFCLAVTKLERAAGRLPDDWVYTLPTEAQWEYAARAGTTTTYSFGDKAQNLNEYGWFGDNTSAADQPYAHQVGMKMPNPWGMYDMHGNVWEWTLDMYSDDVLGGNLLPGGINPKKFIEYRGDAVKRKIVMRGGSWGEDADASRSATRYPYDQPDAVDNFGFRIVLCKPIYNRASEPNADRQPASDINSP